MKKFLMILLLVSLLSLPVLARITVWVSWEGEDWFKETARGWSSKNDREVQVLYIPNLDEKLSLTLKGDGALPDICLIKNDVLPLILKYEEPVPLSEIDTGLQFKESLEAAFTTEEKTRAVPFYADMQLMYLSNTVFEEAGLALPNQDWDIEEFEALMEKLQREGYQPSGWGINSAYIFTGLQSGLGTPVVKPGGTIDIMTDKNIALFEKMKAWYDSGLIHDYVNRPNIIKAFAKKELAMFPQGSFLIPKLNSKGFDFSVRPMPKPWQSVIDPKGFVLFNDSEAVKSLVKTLVSNAPAFSAKYVKYPAINTEDSVGEYYSILKKTVEEGVIQPNAESYTFGYWPAVRTALDLILKENITVEDALKRAQSYIENR